MKVEIRYLPEFERRAKFLAKKYKSFKNDYLALLKHIEESPFDGVSLGGNVYKLRMAIASKGKGKSGGARVLTYVVNRISQEITEVTLLSIFDKNEMENVTDSYIKSLISS